MKKCRLFPLLLALYMLLAAFSLPVSAADTPEDASAEPAQAIAPFTVDAKAAMLVDLNTNRVIYE